MGGLSCCLWWFIAGVLAGWLLNWLFSKLFSKHPPAKGTGSVSSSPTSARVGQMPSPSGRSTEQSPRRVDLEAARRAGFDLRNVDDIAVIDGIGPKIEELFREHGVTTFAQVAKMSVSQLQGILDAGGPNFKLANPATWAQQARLILDNQWDDLKKLHHELAAIAATADPHKH